MPYDLPSLPDSYDALDAWWNVVNWPRVAEQLADAGARHAATV